MLRLDATEKFIYSGKATKFCEIFTLLLSQVPVKSKVKISQNFVAFSEYMNFNCLKFVFLLFLKVLAHLSAFFQIWNFYPFLDSFWIIKLVIWKMHLNDQKQQKKQLQFFFLCIDWNNLYDKNWLSDAKILFRLALAILWQRICREIVNL